MSRYNLLTMERMTGTALAGLCLSALTALSACDNQPGGPLVPQAVAPPALADTSQTGPSSDRLRPEHILFDVYADVVAPQQEQPAYFTQGLLAVGSDYEISLNGTFSVWTPGTWTGSTLIFGNPEAAPRFPSPDTVNGQVGWDPEYEFAHPNQAGPPLGILPAHQGAVQLSLDGGVTWQHRHPRETGYSRSHTYRYVVTGQGAVLGLRFSDGDYRDNYGILRSQVRQLTGNAPR